MSAQWVFLFCGILDLALSVAAVVLIVRLGIGLIARHIGAGGRPFDIWEHIRQRNTAVALLGAGIIVAYALVMAYSLSALSGALASALHDAPGWRNGAALLLGGLANLACAAAVATLAMIVVIRLSAAGLGGLDVRAELAGNNIPLGALYCALLIGLAWLMNPGVTNVCGAVGELIGYLAGTHK